MISVKKLLGKEEKFYDLLEASADEAKTTRVRPAGLHHRRGLPVFRDGVRMPCASWLPYHKGAGLRRPLFNTF
jgi:hypothetical protein